MKRKAGIVAECLAGVDGVDCIDYIADAGFERTFFGSIDHNICRKMKNKADARGVKVEFIHAPFRGINNLWTAGVDYWTIKNQILQTIDVASENDIEGIILHVSSGWNPPQVSDVGIARYDNIVEYAIKKNVVVAFENLRKVGNLACLMDRYEKIENVKFCYDCGHEHCYTATVPMLDLFGDRVIYTHLHDNFGRSYEHEPDLHLLPFEGDIDYKKMMDKLDEYNYQGSLMLEVFNGNHQDLTNEEFLRKAYSCYERINALSEK